MLTIEISEPLRSVLPSLAARFRDEGWWGDATFGTRAEEWVAEDPSATFIRDDHGRTSRGELADHAKRLATALARRGVQRHGIVGLQLPNSAQYAVANLACEYLGAIWVNLSRGYGHREMLEILGHLRADALITDTSHSGKNLVPLIQEVQRDVPSLGVVVTGDACSDSRWFAMSSLLDEPIDESLLAARRLSGGDIYSIALSSGTTSARPKEALRSIDSMLCALRIMNDDFGIGSSDRILVLAPQTGGAGYSYSVAVPCFTGAQADVTELPIGPQLVARILETRPTVLVAVPTQMSRLLDEAGGDRAMWSDLRLIINSGAPLLGEVAARAEETCGCPILSVYGATDGLVPVMSSPADRAEVRHGSVGRVIAGHRVRIVDDAGNTVPTGEIGEIVGFGPGMAFGYVDNAEEMARAWDSDGWWHSGDLGTLDATGHLRVVGRKKEMILRGGVNISPLEIEELLSEHLDIVESAVVAMPHPDLLEQVCAFVVTRNSVALTLADVVAFLREKGMAKYKLPERLEVRDAIPRTAAQKIDKLALRAEIAAVLERERREAGAA